MHRPRARTTFPRLVVGSLAALVIAASIAAAACSKDASDDKPAPAPHFFQSGSLGVDITQFDWGKAKHTTLPSGDDDYEEEGDVVIEGMGEHMVDVEEDIQPTEAGGKVKLTVKDESTGQTRIYSFDPAANALSFSDGTSELMVVQNPDKTYTVDGKPAADGKAAVALLKESPVYADASAWGFIMTYSVCQTCLERASAKGVVDCGGNGVNTSDPPAVCDIFRDLCDCAACDKLGKTPCALCP